MASPFTILCAASLGVFAALLAAGFQPASAAAPVLGVWLFLSSYIVYRIKYPPHHTPQHHSKGLPRTIIGNAVKLYGPFVNDPHQDLKLHFTHVEIPVSEGKNQLFLRGWHIPPPSANANAHKTANNHVCVLAIHGAGRDRRAFLRHCKFLHDNGYGVLLFDCREHGISDSGRIRRGTNFGSRESFDVLRASHYARDELKYSFIVTLGTSQGASSAIIAAALDKRRAIDAVVAENPFYSRVAVVQYVFDMKLGSAVGFLERFRLWWRNWITDIAFAVIGVNDSEHSFASEAIDVVHRIAPRPILFMHSRDDKVVPWSHSEKLYKAAQSPKKLWICDGADHTGLFDAHPEEFKRRVLEFIAEALAQSQLAKQSH